MAMKSLKIFLKNLRLHAWVHPRKRPLKIQFYKPGYILFKIHVYRPGYILENILKKVHVCIHENILKKIHAYKAGCILKNILKKIQVCILEHIPENSL